MPFALGDAVRIVRLRKKGRVTACLKGGRYKVLVGSLQMECAEKDLEPDDAPKAETGKVEGVSWLPIPGQKPVKRVDLHGRSAAQALDRAAEEINRAVLSGLERLELMHGLGTGKLREALHDYLTGLTVVKRFKVDEANPGVTVVYF